MKKPVLQLLRTSTESQATPDHAGIPAQEAANRRTAAQYDLEIVRTIKITDVSGAAVLRSSEMQLLLKLIESPDIHGVVAKECSRLMRPEHFADYALLQAFADTATILYLPEGPIDFRSKSGRLLGTIRAAMAGNERTELLERVWAAKEEKRRAGEHLQGPIALPFAVEYDRKARRWFFKDEAEKVLEAFRYILAGQTSYTEIGRVVGIEPFNLRNILRNPIYTGWRVYTRRRDPSPKALRTTHDGRQADRPKIERASEDIIRVKVLEPLISEEEFSQVQHILDLKKKNHWRARPDHQRRFTFSGFLRCAACENLIYSHSHQPRDWYVCKSRTWPERKLRAARGLPPCTNPYMRRERVEAQLDVIFAQRLTDHNFLERIVLDLTERINSKGTKSQAVRLQRMSKRLQEKRKRVLDTYFSALIERTERDQRLEQIEVDQQFCERQLLALRTERCEISVAELSHIFAPLHEWEYLSKIDKRRLLQAIVPEIHLQNYIVTKLALLIHDDHRNELNHRGRDSWPRRA
jgi:DNA invertase Pin-like site-specific DNA recombinase